MCDQDFLNKLRSDGFHQMCKYEEYRGYTVTPTRLQLQNELDELTVYDDDVWITSFPKCGTTWTQELVWCLCNNLNFEAAKENLDTRFPFLEYCFTFDGADTENRIPYVKDSINYVRNAKRPRFIKTHFPWELLPAEITSFHKRPKIIHIVRNPKDVCASYYHHSKIFQGYKGDMNSFATLFMHDKLYCCPIMKTMLSYWNLRKEPNILILKYEDMKRDLSSEIKRVADFLNVAIDDNQIVRLAEHVDFNSMKQNRAVDHSHMIDFLKEKKICENAEGAFIRKGIVGSHKEEMSPELIAKLDAWIEKELRNTELKF